MKNKFIITFREFNFTQSDMQNSNTPIFLSDERHGRGSKPREFPGIKINFASKYYHSYKEMVCFARNDKNTNHFSQSTAKHYLKQGW